MRLIFIWTVLAITLIFAVLTQTNVWQSYSFSLGVAHPLLGVDHILVMVAVGLWAVLLGGRALWVCQKRQQSVSLHTQPASRFPLRHFTQSASRWGSSQLIDQTGSRSQMGGITALIGLAFMVS